MNPEKLAKLQKAAESGRDTMRRKKKVLRKDGVVDEQKVKNCLKKLSVSTVGSIDEVNMIKKDGSVLHFVNPKVQASVPSNLFSVIGTVQNKSITELLPDILSQLGPESLTYLKELANSATIMSKASEDEVPELIADFEKASMKETKGGK
uniref:Transcription factor BTF3 n=1 Tax=Steinernema glaseri TaxID=37863 RepID=A0A1I7ZXZ0_9BILA